MTPVINTSVFVEGGPRTKCAGPPPLYTMLNQAASIICKSLGLKLNFGHERLLC